MIPKIIHLIWFGNCKLPEQYALHIQNWLDLNPEYQVSCWTSANTIKTIFINDPASKNIVFKNIHNELTPSRNYDLIKEMLDSGNILAAVDLFKIDLMVEHGGYYFDLGISPKTPIDEATVKAHALCELTTSSPSTKTATKGEYRFHASIKEGKLYSLAQDIQRMIIFGLKKDSQSFSVLFSDHPAIKYLATVNVTGVAVFLAIDCLLKANNESTAFVTHFEVSHFGIPKKGTKSQHIMSLGQKLSLDRFKEVLPLVYKEVLRIGSDLAKKSSTVTSHTLFTPLTSHDTLLTEVKKGLSTSSSDIGCSIINSIQKKNYSLALRQACAIGNENLVTLFIKYSSQLPIDFNQTSSNGNSPLIWFNLSKADKQVKEKIKTLLESAIQSTKQHPDTAEVSSPST